MVTVGQVLDARALLHEILLAIRRLASGQSGARYVRHQIYARLYCAEYQTGLAFFRVSVVLDSQGSDTEVYHPRHDCEQLSTYIYFSFQGYPPAAVGSGFILGWGV